MCKEVRASAGCVLLPSCASRIASHALCVRRLGLQLVVYYSLAVLLVLRVMLRSCIRN